MKKYKIALIGTGYIADYHTRALQKLPNTEIVCAVARTAENAKKFAEKYGIKKSLTDISSLVENDELDAVIISTPNKYHAPYAIEFLNKGKDVFLEKPMAMDSKEAELVMKAAQTYNQLVMVGHMWRFDAEANYLRAVIDSGKLGKIIKTKGYGIHENWGPEGWFAQKELAGGGALADMGVHAIDTVRYLMADPKPVEVYAKIGTYYGNYDVDDSGIIMITWDNGATSIIESGWWQPHMDGPEASTGLFGTEGYASLFPTKLKLKIEGVPGEFTPPMPVKADHCDQTIYDGQMKHFVDCIESRKQPVPGLKEGQVITEIVDAAYKSSETGKIVML